MTRIDKEALKAKKESQRANQYPRIQFPVPVAKKAKKKVAKKAKKKVAKKVKKKVAKKVKKAKKK